jgi:surface antigen
MRTINMGSNRPQATGDRDRLGGPMRDRSLPILSRAAVVIAVMALLAFSPIGRQPALGDEDPRDRSYVLDQVNQALETQRTKVETTWSNPETGNGGTIVVEKTFYRDTGEPCRDYRRTLDQSGAPPLVIEGTGCRIGPVQWDIKEKPAAAPEKSKSPAAGTKKGARVPAPATAKKPTTTPPAAGSAAAAGRAPGSPDPASPGPSFTVVKAPCGRPPVFTAYTLPSKAAL